MRAPGVYAQPLSGLTALPAESVSHREEGSLPRYQLGLNAENGAWRVSNDRIGVGPKLTESFLQRAAANQN